MPRYARNGEGEVREYIPWNYYEERSDVVISAVKDMEIMYCVYIMTNKSNTALYTGVTSDLKRRVYEHKIKAVEGFTKRYNIDKLVYYETCDEKDGALWREKQIKSGSRKKKLELIDNMNSKWCDLYETL